MPRYNLYEPVYILLYKYVPGFDVIRNPAKFWAIIYLAMGILFAYAFTIKNIFLSILVSFIIIFLSINMPIHMSPVPDNGKVPAVYKWLDKQKGDFAIAELPLTTITNPDDWVSAWSFLYNQGDFTVIFRQPLSLGLLFYGLRESEREYYSLYHFKRLFNGYSGYWSYLYMNAYSRYTSEKQLALFKSINIKYIIVHKDEFLDRGKLAGLIDLFNTSNIVILKKVYDSENTSVYEILDRNKEFKSEKTYLKDYKFRIFFKKTYTQSGTVNLAPFIQNIGDRPAVLLYKNHLVLETLSMDNKVIQAVKLDFTPSYVPFLLPQKSVPFVFATTSWNSIRFSPEVYKLKLMQGDVTVWESLRNKLIMQE
jgi:hypothetical protein